jgi:hypothetical protein
MHTPIITSDDEYRSYLTELEDLATHDPDPASPAGERLAWLVELVEAYERRRFPFGTPGAPPPLIGQAPAWKLQPRQLLVLDGIRISDLIIAGRGT